MSRTARTVPPVHVDVMTIPQRDYVLAMKACFAAFRTGTLDHHGEFYNLDFITPQWSPGPIDAPDPKVDVVGLPMCNRAGLAHG